MDKWNETETGDLNIHKRSVPAKQTYVKGSLRENGQNPCHTSTDRTNPEKRSPEEYQQQARHVFHGLAA